MTTQTRPAGPRAQARPAGRPLTLGSMCTGHGGLDMAVSAVLDVRPAWVADPDPGAAAILAHRMPGVPNLGDITAVDWTTVPPVDVLAAGYPCQPFSGAGLRKGAADVRHLWPNIARAIRVLRPRIIVLENVANHLRLGFADVLADLAGLGFDAEWCLASASEVGAPHQRRRLFVLAVAQDADRAACGERRQPAPGQAEGGRTRSDARGRGRAPAADPARVRHRDARTPGVGGVAAPSVAGAVADAARLGRPDRPRDDRAGLVLAEPGTGHGDRPRRDAAGVAGHREPAEVVAWGPYAAAIERWEGVLGRPAPRPTEPGRTGERLSPAFVEWLMGVPDGHVTAVPGLTRNAQLKALGNGVVPQQGAAALALLLDRMEAA